jgi:dihydrolipoamide dehydrogenase
MPAVLRRVRALRDDFVAGVLEATEGLGAASVAGRGRLLGPNRVAIGDRVVAAGGVVIATGSSPVLPAAWRALGDRVVTTDDLFDLEDLPPRVGVIGAGAIGVEIAQALARLGVEVEAFDASDRVAGLSDPAVAATLLDALGPEFPLRLGAEVELAAAGAGVEIRAGDRRVQVDKVIAAIGRRPNVADLGLETLGVPLDDRGLPDVDPATMQIGDLPVFLTGDATGGAGLLHEAADEGHIAALNALSPEPIPLARRTPLAIVFCDPGVAVVGARSSSLDPATTITGEVDFARQGRARVAQKNLGLMRIYAARDGGRLLGAEMAAPAAEHMAHLLALAIGRDLSVADLLRMPFYHPTLEEGLRTALRDLARQLPACAPSDLAACPGFDAPALD